MEVFYLSNFVGNEFVKSSGNEFVFFSFFFSFFFFFFSVPFFFFSSPLSPLLSSPLLFSSLKDLSQILGQL